MVLISPETDSYVGFAKNIKVLIKLEETLKALPPNPLFVQHRIDYLLLNSIVSRNRPYNGSCFAASARWFGNGKQAEAHIAGDGPDPTRRSLPARRSTW